MAQVCHFEIRTADSAAAEAFFGELLGWSFTDRGPGYALFDPGREPGGGIEPVAAPRTAIGGGHGFCAKVREPGGATIGLWEPPESES